MTRPLKPQPLWVRVDENRVKLLSFVAVFVTGSALLLTFAFVGVPGTLIGGAGFVLEEWSAETAVRVVALAFVGAFTVLLAAGALAAAVQLSNGEDWVRARFGAVELAAGAEPTLERVCGDMALAAGLAAAPRLLVIESEGVNAGVVGLSRADAALVVTRGTHRFRRPSVRDRPRCPHGATQGAAGVAGRDGGGRIGARRRVCGRRL